jgi:APA family basic amino acid/polyamine antiporter
VLGCLYLFSSLSVKTMLFFAAWNAIGVIVYLVFSRRTSALAAE